MLPMRSFTKEAEGSEGERTLWRQWSGKLANRSLTARALLSCAILGRGSSFALRGRSCRIIKKIGHFAWKAS